MFTFYKNSTQAFWPIAHLFNKYDFMIIAQIIVRLIINLTNTRVVNMLVIKNTA